MERSGDRALQASLGSGFLLHAGRRLAVGPDGLTIGRGEDAQLKLSGAQASRSHARVWCDDGGVFWVEDLGSRHGTALNGERLKDGRHRLASGDAIAFGDELVRFVSGDQTRVASRELPIMETQRVRLEGDRVTIGRDPTNDVVLPDPNVSRFHAEVHSDGDRIEVIDLGSRNGTRLNGSLVERATLSSGAAIGIGPFALTFDGRTFVARDDRGALRLDSEELAVVAGDKQILAPTTLSIEPGEFVAIIGESGAGKSTLVKALAGVTQPSGGRVTVNGEPVSSRLTDIGYVPQDDIVHADLTVREALEYAAELRLPEDTSRQELEETVRWAIDELGLEEHADMRIGSLSGGQRKRTGVAAELLGRPSLLFLDEPTSGLDPGLETRMMELLRELASESRAVAVVTHATKNLRLCNKVAVMGRGGELTFYGSPDDALPFFGVGDFDGIYTALERRPALEWRRLFQLDRTEAGDDGKATLGGTAPDAAAAPPAAQAVQARRRRKRLLPQVAMLTRRYSKLMMRDKRNLALLLGQIPVLGVLNAFIFKAGIFDRPDGSPADAIQLLYLLVIVAIWLGAIDSAREIVKERTVLERESAVGMRLSAYLTSKFVVLFSIAAVQALGFAAIVTLLRPLDASVQTYVEVFALLVAAGIVGVTMGLAISAAVDSEDQSVSIIPLALIPQMLFAGAIVPALQMSAPIEFLSRLMFSQWGFAAVGTSVDMNARMEENPQGGVDQRFGTDFFDVSIVGGLLVLALFAAVFVAVTALLLRRRVSR